MMRENTAMQRILGVIAVLALSAWTSTSTWADETTRAYNMGYVDACNHSGGRLVDHGDRYHCYPHGGRSVTKSFMETDFVGSVPGGWIGVAGGESEMRFCDPTSSSTSSTFDTAFPTQRILELAHGSTIIDADVADAIRSGRALSIEGYAFDGDVSFKSKGVLSWQPNGLAEMTFSTNCATATEPRTAAIKYLEEMGMNKAMIIERFLE